MRKPSHRSRAAVAVLTAALLGVTGCDAVGGGSSEPTQKAKPTAQPASAWDTSPDSVAAVGDSITRGFDACSVLHDCPEVSWATGSRDDVDSLAVRLLGKSGAEERSWNYAETGARMADLSGQMTEAAARSPELVTVMIGANDACRDSTDEMTSVDDFRDDFEDSLSVLHEEAPDAEVYVSSVPDLKRLWSQGRDSRMARAVWRLDICPTMLDDAESMDAAAVERRDAVQDRVQEYNEALEEVCAENRFCRFDDGAVYDYQFGTEQLSRWDWFHPSVNGQARLAEIAYRRVTSVT
ncbi:SGNH/GDSL hydrolase family protein [Streptomyces blattellae]|uniref:SGNH/GDSL hydrolase family protein n=1 Tax=Streptomyces blattellae TaxID=2569855 RepID=UPI0012B785FB|nr:SGNH/GDSL hydrolase family protein [Streptomyces blattellae]